MEGNNLLELRARIKANKPAFIRQESHRIKINNVWRKPKGLHSKMRHHIKGKRKSPSPGYGSPAEVKGLHKSGLIPIVVSNINQLPLSKEYGVIIASTVGMKTRVELIKKASDLGIKILNIDAVSYLKKAEELVLSRKKKKEQEKKKESEKKSEKGKSESKDSQSQRAEEPKTIEEKKEEEKREKDKLLTKRT